MGKSKKTLDGSAASCQSELVARFDAYRRLELRYAQITAMRAVRREAGGVLVAGNARFELRFRLNFKKVRTRKRLRQLGRRKIWCWRLSG